MARKIFLSFHYEKDVIRTQQIRNMGVLSNNQLIQPNDWENIKRGGEQAIRNWINDQMNYKDCIIVLVGEETSERKWVLEEIKLANQKGKPMFGIYIHNLKDFNGNKSIQGKNPFDSVFGVGKHKYTIYNPRDFDIEGMKAYNDISNNIASWIDSAIASKYFINNW